MQFLLYLKCKEPPKSNESVDKSLGQPVKLLKTLRGYMSCPNGLPTILFGRLSEELRSLRLTCIL